MSDDAKTGKDWWVYQRHILFNTQDDFKEKDISEVKITDPGSSLFCKLIFQYCNTSTGTEDRVDVLYLSTVAELVCT